MPIGELSRRVGVSSDLLRKWERRYGVLTPGRTRGNQRLYSRVDEARVRLMLNHVRSGVPAAQAAELAVAARFRISSRDGQPEPRALQEAAEARGRLMAALERYDETAAEQVLEKLIASVAVATIIRDVFLPFMREIGERWADAHLSVAQEHFASGFVLGRLLGLARGWDRGLGPRAVLACAPGEQHTFGLISFGIALHEVGWRITYLGADTPVEMVAQAAAAIEPRLVVVTATMPGALLAHDGAVRALAARWPLALAGPGITAESAAALGMGDRVRRLDGDPVVAAGRILP